MQNQSRVRFTKVALIWAASLGIVLMSGVAALAGDDRIDRFVGRFTGDAVVAGADGADIQRSMDVEISKKKTGFSVRWTSVSSWGDGRSKEKSYSIEFVPTERPGVYAAAQEKDLFGHAVQLDPMKGEPYVWARIMGHTLTVYSLFVGPEGDYEMQQYDRTLTTGGLDLRFERIHNGSRKKLITTFLERQ